MHWEAALAEIGDRAEQMNPLDLYDELVNRGVDGEQAEEVVRLFEEE